MYLEASRSAPLDSWLTPAQIALATAVRSMIEEHLYWVLVYQRWQDERGSTIYQPVVIALIAAMGFPRFLCRLISLQSRRIILAQLRGQGMGRHTAEEVTAAGVQIIDSLTQLFQAPFFMGDRICTLDATSTRSWKASRALLSKAPSRIICAGSPNYARIATT